MKHDNSKTIKLSSEHIARASELSKKYGMNESELFRLGLDFLYHFEHKNELMKIVQKLMETLGDKK